MMKVKIEQVQRIAVPDVVENLLALASVRAAAVSAGMEDVRMEVGEISAVVDAAQELVVLLQSVQSLQALVRAAQCPQCGYEFLNSVRQ